jgi:hypothetical protein
MRDWARTIAAKAEQKQRASGRVGRRVNREKELFTLRARHVKRLFDDMVALAAAVNDELAEHALRTRRSLNPKNLGGIEVPDQARLAIEFLERRLEIVVQPLASIGGRPAPLGPLATASVIQYDRLDPASADWFEIAVREDGIWQRRAADEAAADALTDAGMRTRIEWLVT